MSEVDKYACLKQLRKRTGLPLLKCREIVEEADHDLEKALRIADGRPEISELVRLLNLPDESKIKTEDHCVPVTCPHCNKEFFKLSEGAYAEQPQGER